MTLCCVCVVEVRYTRPIQEEMANLLVHYQPRSWASRNTFTSFIATLAALTMGKCQNSECIVDLGVGGNHREA